MGVQNLAPGGAIVYIVFRDHLSIEIEATTLTSPHYDTVMLKEGDKAPPFSLSAYPDETVSLANFAGSRNVILAFYPRDKTPGCTKEMCGFSERKQRFEANDTVILGVSADSLGKHQEFATEYGITVPLLTDTSGEAAKAYGAAREGKATFERILFVIDKNGRIRYRHEGMPDYDQLLSLVERVQADT